MQLRETVGCWVGPGLLCNRFQTRPFSQRRRPRSLFGFGKPRQSLCRVEWGTGGTLVSEQAGHCQKTCNTEFKSQSRPCLYVYVHYIWITYIKVCVYIYIYICMHVSDCMGSSMHAAVCLVPVRERCSACMQHEHHKFVALCPAPEDAGF